MADEPLTEKTGRAIHSELVTIRKLLQATSDPRLVTSAYGQEVLKQAKSGGESKSGPAKFDAARAPDRG